MLYVTDQAFLAAQTELEQWVDSNSQGFESMQALDRDQVARTEELSSMVGKNLHSVSAAKLNCTLTAL